MPKGGIRPRSSDGSLAHLLQPKWNLGRTRTIRVPVVLADQLLEIAHKLDEGELLDLTRDNRADDHGYLIDLTQDKIREESSHPIDLLTQHKKTEGSDKHIDLIQHNKAALDRLKASQAKAIALLQNAITPKSKGGSYAANNATGIKRLVEQALALLGSEGDARPIGLSKKLI